jgi:hypothetical protein
MKTAQQHMSNEDFLKFDAFSVLTSPRNENSSSFSTSDTSELVEEPSWGFQTGFILSKRVP